jgi:signal transduction histidine kinase
VPESVRAVIERIERRAERLRKRISDILLVGELRSQAGRPDTAPVANLRKVVEDSIEQSGALAAAKHVALQVEVPPLNVAVDARQLTILVANLVSNAITYSQDGKSVEVRAREGDGRIFLVVSDQGMGIAEADLPRIFEDYYRTEAAAEVNKMSTGLGLSIVREIATKWRLSVEVTSEPGKGTTFEIGMPGSAA